ncbi:hypothetical protein Bca52824_074621 [Brassica carinata]|uniref:Uncharacterized protein n=1 Tax=Brassica carinata TaxID=52824 RepID=A0A8X7PR90_BRACI|nr:hypothetical protein Bca52824_074621 [Brassica carinata]
MDIVEHHDKGILDAEDHDDDLLGADLMEMEGIARLSGETMKDKGVNVENKPVRHRKLGVKRVASLGSSSRKFEILRRGSPSKRSARSGSFAPERAVKSRRHRSGQKKDAECYKVGSAALSTTRMKNGNIELELSGWLGDWMWSQPGVKLKVL